MIKLSFSAIAKAGIILGLISGTLFLLSFTNFPLRLAYHEGDIAQEAWYAPFDFEAVKKGELIVDKGERVTKEQLEMLKELKGKQFEGEGLIGLLGNGILLTLLFIVFFLYLRGYAPSVYSNNSQLLLLSLILFFVLIAGRLMSFTPAPSYLMPQAFAPMACAMLLGVAPAAMVAVASSFLCGMMMADKLQIASIYLLSSMVGLYAVRRINKRVDLMKAGFFVGAVNFISIIGLDMFSVLDMKVAMVDASWGLAGGLLSGSLLMVGVPLFEYAFNITTDITLLELSNRNHPLLKELLLKAPGTYQHSLVVGNLAEVACEAIGANALLSRVASYYHDIGKIENSEYFSENQLGAGSEHDKLSPTMSNLIIINHVKRGLELAKKYRLNRAVTDFIIQHHGTGLIYFFYKRALEEIEDIDEVKEEAFRYPGPKPQTKETAITLLADSVEAASRALVNPTSPRLAALVKRVINNKFIDGQLDECELTLKDLNKIAEAFLRVLLSIYHTRVSYAHEHGEDAEPENRGSKRAEGS